MAALEPHPEGASHKRRVSGRCFACALRRMAAGDGRASRHPSGCIARSRARLATEDDAAESGNDEVFDASDFSFVPRRAMFAQHPSAHIASSRRSSAIQLDGWPFHGDLRCLVLPSRACACNPRRVGAIAPSGASLASLITRESPPSGPVLELGPGTGVFTQALLARGVKEHDLTLIEYGSDFVRRLQTRFPRARVLWMDAAWMASYDLFETPLGAVVSGLPLLNFPERKVSCHPRCRIRQAARRRRLLSIHLRHAVSDTACAARSIGTAGELHGARAAQCSASFRVPHHARQFMRDGSDADVAERELPAFVTLLAEAGPVGIAGSCTGREAVRAAVLCRVRAARHDGGIGRAIWP